MWCVIFDVYCNGCFVMSLFFVFLAYYINIGIYKASQINVTFNFFCFNTIFATCHEIYCWLLSYYYPDGQYYIENIVIITATNHRVNVDDAAAAPSNMYLCDLMIDMRFMLPLIVRWEPKIQSFFFFLALWVISLTFSSCSISAAACACDNDDVDDGDGADGVTTCADCCSSCLQVLGTTPFAYGTWAHSSRLPSSLVTRIG